MEDYIASTLRAYDDTQKYEESTRNVVPVVELEQFIQMLPPHAMVLDAGCAFGRDTAYLQPKGVKARGIDLSPALIDRAKELYPDFDFSVADVRQTGFADGTFDGVWSNATLLHLNDKDMLLALKEFKRILKPGGVVVVSLKKGEGTQKFVEKFSSNSERFFNFKTHDTFFELVSGAGLHEEAWHYLNERERYGQDKRDLDWLYTFLRKPVDK